MENKAKLSHTGNYADALFCIFLVDQHSSSILASTDGSTTSPQVKDPGKRADKDLPTTIIMTSVIIAGLIVVVIIIGFILRYVYKSKRRPPADIFTGSPKQPTRPNVYTRSPAKSFLEMNMNAKLELPNRPGDLPPSTPSASRAATAPDLQHAIARDNTMQHAMARDNTMFVADPEPEAPSIARIMKAQSMLAAAETESDETDCETAAEMLNSGDYLAATDICQTIPVLIQDSTGEQEYLEMKPISSKL